MGRRHKCRNENCLLNYDLKCGNPLQHRKDFTCANMDVKKKRSKKVNWVRNYKKRWKKDV